MKPISDALLGAMVRTILAGCPEFQVMRQPHSGPMFIEVSAIYTDDLPPEQMAKIRKALERIATLHRQHIAGTDAILHGERFQVYLPGEDGKYHIADDNGNTLCGARTVASGVCDSTCDACETAREMLLGRAE